MSQADLILALSYRDMLTVAEAAVWFNVSRNWFFDRIERREIPFYGQRRSYRVSKAEVEAYLRRDRTPADCEIQNIARKHILNKSWNA